MNPVCPHVKVHLGLFVCLFFLDQGIQTRGLAAPPNAGDTSGLAEDSLQRFTFPGEGAEGPLCRGKGDLDGAARVYQSPGRSLGLFFWTPKRMKLQPEIQRAPLPRVFMGPPLGTKYNPGREETLSLAQSGSGIWESSGAALSMGNCRNRALRGSPRPCGPMLAPRVSAMLKHS